MAKNRSTVYLGYLDERISKKYQTSVDFKTNKIGGIPDFPLGGVVVPNCPICSLTRPLIVQIYAPLDQSAFHRTIFVFACLNPRCSVQSSSWLCIRSQVLEKQHEKENVTIKQKREVASVNNIFWCSGADDWDECLENDNYVPPGKDINDNDEIGNAFRNDNSPITDEDDESTSGDLITELDNMQIDEKNANYDPQADGAVGLMYKNQASAEIEGEETELISIDTPISPQRDLMALLKHTVSLNSDNGCHPVLQSSFIYVEEEPKSSCRIGHEHVRELLHDYQMKDQANPDSPSDKGGRSVADQEQYEKVGPAHGDIIFHDFLMKIEENPGQIIRYSRDSSPLLTAPLKEKIPKCVNCGSEVICELQILSKLIPHLRLENNDCAVPIEFGNVLIFTCLKSCWDTPDKTRTEICIVQQEF